MTATTTASRATQPRYRYKTKDILTIAVVSVVGGVISALVAGPWAKFIEGVMGPFGMGLDFPLFALWAPLAGLLVRKPGVAFITSVLTGLCELLFGGVDGAVTLVFCLMQGVGAELGLLAFRYRPTLPAAIVSNGISAVFCAVTSMYVYGYVVFALSLQVGLLAWMLVVPGVIGGVLAWLIARGIFKTGAYTL